MGKARRAQPERLASKLHQIRVMLDLSQTQMLRRLGLEDDYHYTLISFWERGKLEPPLRAILNYARVIDISTDCLIDDDLDLPPIQEKKKKKKKKIS